MGKVKGSQVGTLYCHLSVPGQPPMMTLSLTVDHRVIDGSVGASFLQRVKNLLENPALMLA